MSDALLPYYNEELTYIRSMAAEFAKSHPKIAARLRISSDAIEDPHVERLIEAADGNQSLAARLLGLNRDKFRYRLRAYGIKPEGRG